jgi:hypothetical protein
MQRDVGLVAHYPAVVRVGRDVEEGAGGEIVDSAVVLPWTYDNPACERSSMSEKS